MRFFIELPKLQKKTAAKYSPTNFIYLFFCPDFVESDPPSVTLDPLLPLITHRKAGGY